MQLLSALSSTTSPLAMQAMPLVGSPAGDFAALIADMVPAGDAAVATGPVERQAAAPGGNGLPVAIAAPVALVEMPVVAAPAITPPLPDTIPTPDPQRRVDGWSPARQRRFLEILAATGVIMLACEGVHITARSAYTLRIRHDGAAFRLGWDAAILIARAREGGARPRGDRGREQGAAVESSSHWRSPHEINRQWCR